MKASSPAIPGLNKLAGEVLEATLTLTLKSEQDVIFQSMWNPMLSLNSSLFVLTIYFLVFSISKVNDLMEHATLNDDT